MDGKRGGRGARVTASTHTLSVRALMGAVHHRSGSERLSRTNATGDRLKEAQNINKSLSALGDVIQVCAACVRCEGLHVRVLSLRPPSVFASLFPTPFLAPSLSVSPLFSLFVTPPPPPAHPSSLLPLFRSSKSARTHTYTRYSKKLTKDIRLSISISTRHQRQTFQRSRAPCQKKIEAQA